MKFVAYAVVPGLRVRRIGAHKTIEEALEIGRLKLKKGECLSVNRDDVQPPSIRASELLAGVGKPMTKEDSAKRMIAAQRAGLQAAQWARKNKRNVCKKDYEEENS